MQFIKTPLKDAYIIKPTMARANIIARKTPIDA